jgi:hypothetical protein
VAEITSCKIKVISLYFIKKSISLWNRPQFPAKDICFDDITVLQRALHY